jgi:hypothetical protein
MKGYAALNTFISFHAPFDPFSFFSLSLTFTPEQTMPSIKTSASSIHNEGPALIGDFLSPDEPRKHKKKIKSFGNDVNDPHSSMTSKQLI